MKNLLPCLFLLLTLFAARLPASAQGTAFTYQGRLNNGGSPASGLFDLQFTLFDAASNGNLVGSSITNLAVGVTNGLFTTIVDFGSVFNGEPLWLQIGVETNGAGGNFIPLGTLQPLTSVPFAVLSTSSSSAGTANFANYAATAGSAATANNVPNGSVTSADIAAGQVVKSLNGLQDNVTLAVGPNLTITPSGNTLTINTTGSGGSSANSWSLTGNAGTSPASGNFLGTTDLEPLELWVDGMRALRLEPDPGGGLILDNSTSMVFGDQTRQMLTLYRDPTYTCIYGIGVQNSTFYMRTGTNGGFAWYQGGSHNDAQNNPGTGKTMMTLDSAGNLRTTTGAIASLSDRNAKDDFAPVNPQDLLARVSALPLTTWHYKTADASQRHIGPMAQDFYAAFNVGLDDKSICTVDEGGVALAAIQGLNQEVQAKEVRIQEQAGEIATLQARLDKLEKLVATRLGGTP